MMAGSRRGRCGIVLVGESARIARLVKYFLKVLDELCWLKKLRSLQFEIRVVLGSRPACIPTENS